MTVQGLAIRRDRHLFGNEFGNGPVHRLKLPDDLPVAMRDIGRESTHRWDDETNSEILPGTGSCVSGGTSFCPDI